jgi:hypothetical protein
MVLDGPSDFDEERYYNIIDTIQDEQQTIPMKNFNQHLVVTDYRRPESDFVGEMSAPTVKQISESQMYT